MLQGKTCLKPPLKKKTEIGFQDELSLICRLKVLQNAPREHSAILSTFIKLPFVVKTFVLSILAAVLDRFNCIFEQDTLFSVLTDCFPCPWLNQYKAVTQTSETFLHSKYLLNYLYLRLYHFITDSHNVDLPSTLPNDPDQLKNLRKNIAMELLWVQQAIHSRKNVSL